MVAAEDAGYLVHPLVVGDGGLHPVRHTAGAGDIGFQRGGGVDAQFGDVDVEFQVVVLEGGGGGDDGGRAVAGAAAVGGGAVNGDGDEDGGGGRQGGLPGREGQEVGRGVGDRGGAGIGIGIGGGVIPEGVGGGGHFAVDGRRRWLARWAGAAVDS